VTQTTLHVVFTVAGAGCEIAGLAWLVANASRARSEEFGEHGPFRRMWDWLAYWFGPPPEPVELRLGAAVVTSSASATITTGEASETEIERLQRELEQLRERLERHEEHTTQRFSTLDDTIRQHATDLAERIDQVAVQQRELHHTALRRDIRAGALFIFGALLSAVANLV
jgi:nucleotide-binding universal stress UspA family protein